MNIVDFDEPTSFHDHFFVGCTQRECRPNESIIEECRNMFNQRKESPGPGFRTDCRRVHVDWRCVAKRICAWSSSLVTDPRTCGMSFNVSHSYIDCLICFFCDVFCLMATWSVNSLCICMSRCYSLSKPTRAVCLSGRASISHTFVHTE